MRESLTVTLCAFHFANVEWISCVLQINLFLLLSIRYSRLVNQTSFALLAHIFHLSKCTVLEIPLIIFTFLLEMLNFDKT